MAQSKETGTERAAYTYTPGDGHRYTWDGGPVVTVETITTVAGVLVFTPGDPIRVGTIRRTVTAFTDAVDAIRAHR